MSTPTPAAASSAVSSPSVSSLSAAIPTPELDALRQTVRTQLAEWARDGLFTPGVDGWLIGWSDEFSAELARRGWVGMTIPQRYGGGGRSHLERFVVTEELLLAGAPVAAHWIADRQVAPSVLRAGTDRQRAEILPRIAAAEWTFALGMSEPDAGSDLAGVRTRATKTEHGWRINGTKIWTSGAHHADKILLLARTSGVHGDRHQGLSQFIVDLDTAGVTVSPIPSMDGGHHFNEVFFDDCEVADDQLLGAEGDGWHQVSAELGYERSGPERFLSSALMVKLLVDSVAGDAATADPRIGQLLARLQALREMSLSVAVTLESGMPADNAAALVKMLGTATEGDVIELADYLSASDPESRLRAVVDRAVVQRPGFTLRGGTNEILSGIVARGLGLR